MERRKTIRHEREVLNQDLRLEYVGTILTEVVLTFYQARCAEKHVGSFVLGKRVEV
jgi:hypothetical protein